MLFSGKYDTDIGRNLEYLIIDRSYLLTGKIE